MFSIEKNKIIISIKPICYFAVFFVLSYKIIADGLKQDCMTNIAAEVLCCICMCMTILIKGIKKFFFHKNIYAWFDLVIFAIFVAVIFRRDSFWQQDLFMLVALIIITRFNFIQFETFVLASLCACIPFFLKWILAMVKLHEYLGNRGPIIFTTIIVLLVALMYIKRLKPIWLYSVLALAIVIDFVGNSRTYLIVCAMAFVLITYYNFKGKLTIKKMLTVIGIIILSAVVVIKVQDKLINLFTNKWSGQTNIFVGRSMMWTDVLSNLKWTGYPENYIHNKYMLGNVHNGFIQAYVSYGVIVGILYLALIIIAIVKCIKNRNDIVMQGFMIAFIPVTIASFFESNFIMEKEYLFLGVCNAILIGQIIKSSANIVKTEKNIS